MGPYSLSNKTGTDRQTDLMGLESHNTRLKTQKQTKITSDSTVIEIMINDSSLHDKWSKNLVKVYSKA